MGYQMTYTQNTVVKTPIGDKKKSKSFGYIIAVVFLGLLLLRCVGMFLDFLLMGNIEQTQKAAEVFIQHIKEGEAISAAVESFYQEVVY